MSTTVFSIYRWILFCLIKDAWCTYKCNQIIIFNRILIRTFSWHTNGEPNSGNSIQPEALAGDTGDINQDVG